MRNGKQHLDHATTAVTYCRTKNTRASSLARVSLRPARTCSSRAVTVPTVTVATSDPGRAHHAGTATTKFSITMTFPSQPGPCFLLVKCQVALSTVALRGSGTPRQWSGAAGASGGLAAAVSPAAAAPTTYLQVEARQPPAVTSTRRRRLICSESLSTLLPRPHPPFPRWPES